VFKYQIPACGILSKHDAWKIHSKAVELLERVGVDIFHSRALKLLKQAGAKVDNYRAFIPESVIDKTLEYLPSHLTIYNQDGQVAMRLAGRNNYFGSGSDCPFIIDTLTGERRLCKEKDVEEAAWLIENLPHLNFSMSLGLISDRPWYLQDVYQFRAQALNTKKPILFTSRNRCNSVLIKDIASVLVDGIENLCEYPFVIQYLEPSSPLSHTKDAIDKLLFHAETYLPAVYASGPIAGATVPITPAAAVAIAWAECLSGNAIAQLWNSGSPIIFGASFSVLDMHHAVLSHAAPAAYFMNATFNELCKFFNVPCFTIGGCSDSKIPDMQATIEYVISLLVAAISGGNLIHDLGYLESGKTSSLKMLVYANMIVEMLKRFYSTANFVESSFAGVEQGNFSNLRRAGLETLRRLQQGSNIEEQAAKEIVHEILSKQKPTIDPDCEKSINELIQKVPMGGDPNAIR